MEDKKEIGLDFEIDELTNSVRNTISGDSFPTEVIRITKTDLKSVTKKNRWQFDWKLELKYPERDIFELTIVNNESIIKG